MGGTSDEDTARVVALIRDGHGRNAVVRETGVPASTVSRIARRTGLTFDRSPSVQAVQAVVADGKIRRARLGDALLGDLEQVRTRVLLAQTPRELQAISQGLDALMRAYSNLVKVDGVPDPHGAEHVQSMVGGLLSLISTQAELLPRMNPTAGQE